MHASIPQTVPSEAPSGRRSLVFLGSNPLSVAENACRGCVMNEVEPMLSDLLAPVYDDGTITVRQDAEWPVPGFMVVAVRPHLGSRSKVRQPRSSTTWLPDALLQLRLNRAVRTANPGSAATSAGVSVRP
jgi:hypothetical protein